MNIEKILITVKVAALLQNRRFYVDERQTASSTKQQQSGISQGCTLSPLLFITVMSLVMQDAVALLSPAAQEAYKQGDLADLAFADDPLLLGVSKDILAEYLAAVATAGERYGLSLHYDKFQLLNIGCHGGLTRADG